MSAPLHGYMGSDYPLLVQNKHGTFASYRDWGQSLAQADVDAMFEMNPNARAWVKNKDTGKIVYERKPTRNKQVDA